MSSSVEGVAEGILKKKGSHVRKRGDRCPWSRRGCGRRRWSGTFKLPSATSKVRRREETGEVVEYLDLYWKGNWTG